MSSHWHDDEGEANEDWSDFQFGGKDAILFAIDCSPKMHIRPSTDTDEEDEDHELGSRSLTPFQMGVSVACATLKSKVFAAPNDMVGILLFGTKQSIGVDNFENLSVLCPVENPNASSIIELESWIEEKADLESKYGASDNYKISDVLWQSQSLLNNVTAGKVGSKRILLITNEDNPHKNQRHLEALAATKAGDLFHNQIFLDVLPIGSSFKMSRFYRDIVKLADNDTAELLDPASEYEDLLKVTRKRIHKKRSIGKVMLNFGQGLKISVASYNFVQKSYKPSKVRLAKDTNDEVKTQRNFFHPSTGAPLLPSDIDKFQDYGGKKIKFTQDEVKGIAMLDGNLGMKLIGFKPKSSLKWAQFVRSSSFVYPDEKLIQGSRRLFSALLIKCLERQVVPICSFKARDNSGPSYVALLPQEEVKDEGEQVTPPGFHVIFLPFADDVRTVPETTHLNEPEPEQLSAGKALIKKMKLSNYRPDAFENPDIQTHFALIEGLALSRDEIQPPKDQTLPPMDILGKKLEKVGKEFLDAVYPSGYDPMAVTTKRKAPATKDRHAKKEKVDPEALDIKKIIFEKSVHKLTVAVLREYLAGLGIETKGMKKADLVEKVYQI